MTLLCVSFMMSCSNIEDSDEAPRYHHVNAILSAPSTKTQFSEIEQSLGLSVKWQGFEYINVFYKNTDKYNDTHASAQIGLVTDDGSGAAFSYDVPPEWGKKSMYDVKCFTSTCHPKLEKNKIYIGAELQRHQLKEFLVPVYYEGTVDGEGQLCATFQHYYTYELLHIRNISDSEVRFALKKFEAPGGVWYRVRGSVCVEDLSTKSAKDAFYENGPVNFTPVESSETVKVPSGGSDVILSAYVPNGKFITDATMVAEIDGRTVRSSNTLSSEAMLEQGHAYHMRAVWNGAQLKFLDGRAIEAQSVTASRTTVFMDLGGRADAGVKLLPEGASWETVECTSSSPDVAYVQDGIIVAKKAGTALIKISTWGGQSVTLTVAVTYPTLTDELELSKTTLKFRDAMVGGWSEETVELFNADDVAHTVTIDIPQEDFSIGDDGNFTIRPGETRILHVTFYPKQVGPSSGTLTVSAAYMAGTLTLPLSGIGLAAPENGEMTGGGTGFGEETGGVTGGGNGFNTDTGNATGEGTGYDEKQSEDVSGSGTGYGTDTGNITGNGRGYSL